MMGTLLPFLVIDDLGLVFVFAPGFLEHPWRDFLLPHLPFFFFYFLPPCLPFFLLLSLGFCFF